MKPDLAARLRREAAELLALADDIERELTPAALAPVEDLVSTGVAMKITKRSQSWLYATAREHPELRIGHKSPTGAWLWSARALRALFEPACEESVRVCEISAPAPLQPLHESEHP